MKITNTKDGKFKGSFSIPVELDVKELSENGSFEGYASTYGNIDKGGDIVQFGAFDESLRRKPTQKVKMLLHHDTYKPVGVWERMVSDNKGLFVSGQLLLSTRDGKETHEFLKAGILDSLSIGYRTKEFGYDREAEVRTIIKAELMEVSIVTFPMNELATISGVKSFEVSIDDFKTLSDAERFLREVERPFSRKEALGFVSKIKRIAQCEAGSGSNLNTLLVEISSLRDNVNSKTEKEK